MEMSVIVLIVIIVIILAALVWGIATYNNLVINRNMVAEGWSGIDVQLKRRSDLIPNLIETVKGYMGHEKGVLEDVTAMRAKAMNAEALPERAQAEGMLSAALSKMFALAENYPDLKASANFIELQKSLSDIEDQLQLARRYYNGTARNFNIMIESFPSSIIANLFHFNKANYFEVESAAEREAPKVKF